MVKHGTQKKRRSGRKTTRKSLPKHRDVKVANSIQNLHIKKIYNKNITPSENLQSFGLLSDVNNLKGKSDSILPLSANAAFLGFGKVLNSNDDNEIINHMSIDTNPKRKVISEFDQNYAKVNIDKHGDNYKAMEKDIIVNNRQYTANQMEKLCNKYHQVNSI